MLEKLRREVCEANLAMHRAGLVTLTWGNVSGYDRAAGAFAIKPSGMPYHALTADDMVVVSLEDERVLWGALKPSSDSPTHAVLYREFVGVGGIVHTHSTHATAWAQARRPIPCYGTTHADHFYGEVPVTAALTADRIEGDYERLTGVAIVEAFEGLNPLHVPAALVACHGPFVWGPDPLAATENAIVLEEVARMATLTEALAQDPRPISGKLLDKHFLRKHGPAAYYGQSKG